MAASLLARIQLDWKNRWGIAEPGHELLSQLQRCAKPGVAKWLEKYAGGVGEGRQATRD